jgi:hypothetical protein
MLVLIWIHVHWLCAAVFVAAARGALSGELICDALRQG